MICAKCGYQEATPQLCPKSANPYTYCPLVFKHADEMIASYCIALAMEIRRTNRLDMQISGDDAKAIDRYCGEITAYMNGRIHELVRIIKEKEGQ